MGLHLLAQYVIIFCPFFWVRCLGYLCVGICNLKNSTSFAWLIEFMETSNKMIASTAINGFDFTTLIFVGFYFLYFSKSWFGLFLFHVLLNTVCWLILAWIAPESPKWLLVKNKKEEAIQAFN